MSEESDVSPTGLILMIGRMDAKIDLLLFQNNKHGDRISALEAWKNRALGISMAVGAIAGGLSGYVPKLFAIVTKN